MSKSVTASLGRPPSASSSSSSSSSARPCAAPRSRATPAALFAIAALGASCAEEAPREPDAAPDPALSAIGAAATTEGELADVVPESVSVGTSLDLDAHVTEEPFALPPRRAMIEIVGISIENDTDHVVTWFADGTVSVGYSKDLDLYTAPTPYTLPAGRAPRDIVGIGIAANNRAYAWFRDGKISSGASITNLTQLEPGTWNAAPTETRDNVAGLDFAADGRVYAWYRDLKRSVGTLTALGAHEGAVSFDPAEGQKPTHIVETAIAGNDRVYTWYQDMERGEAWPAVANAVDELIVAKLRAKVGAGVTVAISKDGRLVMERAYGYRDVDSQEALMP
jgi:hypothetical protein